MPLDQNPHQKVTRFGCVGFSMYACEISVPQMRQFCMFTNPPRSKWASSEKMIFFAKIGIICKSIAGPLLSVVQAYIQPYSFGGKIKLIIYQIRYKLSVTIHEISTSWKNTLDGGPYMCCYILGWKNWGLALNHFNTYAFSYIHNLSLQNFSQDSNLASHTTCIVCVNVVMSGGTLNDRF